MTGRFSKAKCLLALTALLASAPAYAGILYDSTGSPRYYNPLDGAPIGYNVNSVPGATADILWDDAPINVGSMTNPFVQVTRLTFDILRVANAGAVNIDIYWTNMVPDAGLNRGTSTFPQDTPVDDPGSPVFVQTISLGVNGASAVRQLVTVGNGTDVLFTTGVLNTTTADAATTNGVEFTYPLGTHPGYGYFMLGMKMSNTTENNTWVVASNPNNLFWVWDDFQDDLPSTIDEFYFGPDAAGDNMLGTMSMKIEGNLVPEPASLATLGLVAVGLLARRRIA